MTSSVNYKEGKNIEPESLRCSQGISAEIYTRVTEERSHSRSLSNLGNVAPLAAISGSTVSKNIVQGFSLSLKSII